MCTNKLPVGKFIESISPPWNDPYGVRPDARSGVSWAWTFEEKNERQEMAMMNFIIWNFTEHRREDRKGWHLGQS